MKKKNVTIEDLARMVKKGFDETAKRDEVNTHFEQVDARFKKMDVHFEQVDARFDGVNRRFDAIDNRFDRIEKLMLADHKKRIEKLETEVKELKELLVVG